MSSQFTAKANIAAVKTSFYDYANTINLGLLDRKGVEYGEVSYVVKSRTVTKKISPDSPGVWTINAGLQDDIIDTGTGIGITDGSFNFTGGSGLDTFIIQRGSATIMDLGSGGNEILKVSSGATANATVTSNWTAGATTSNSGTASVDAAGYTVNLSAAVGSNGWTLTNSGAAATLTGSTQNDTITGGSGNDTLVGGSGVDSLNGANGDDSYLYGSSADFVTGTAVVDSINDTGGTADKVQITGAISIDNTQSLDRVAGVERLVAAPNAAVLAHSIAISSDASLGSLRWFDLSTSTHADSSAVVDLTGVTASVEIDGVANGVNTLTGGSGDDTLAGGSGVDSLSGGAGNDTYRYASSAAFMSGTAVVDNINESAGTADKVEIAGAISIDASQSLERAVGVEQLVAAANSADALAHSIVIGSAAALQDIRTIDLSGSSNIGSTGVVNLDGAMEGPSAAGLSLTGVSAGTNDLTSGSGNDTLTGGSGADTLTGGIGNDSLILTESTAAADQVVLHAYWGNESDSRAVHIDGDSNDTGGDTVTGFAPGSDTIKVVASNVSRFIPGIHTAVGTADGADDATAAAFVTTAGLISLDDNVTFDDLGDIAINFSSALTRTDFENSLQYDLVGTDSGDLLGTGIHNDAITAGEGDDFVLFAGGDDTIDGGVGADTLLVRGGGEVNHALMSGVETVVAVVAADNTPVTLDLTGSTGISRFEAHGAYSAGGLSLTGNSGVSITGVGGAFSQVLIEDFGTGNSDEETFKVSVADGVFTGGEDTLDVTLYNAGAGPVKVPAKTLDDDVLSDGDLSEESIEGEYAILDIVNDSGDSGISVIEHYNIVSNGGSERGNFIKVDHTMAATSLIISGDTDLNLNFNAYGDEYTSDGKGALEMVDASLLIGNLWLRGVGIGTGLTITGSHYNNDLTASPGNDTITTFAGDDIIIGGRGDDVIVAGEGNNEVRGGEGSNTITTGAGNDFIHAGGYDHQDPNAPDPADWVYDNTVDAGGGDDVVQVGVFLNAGDSINGGEGNDTLWTDLSEVTLGNNNSGYMDGFEILRIGFDWSPTNPSTVNVANYDSIQHLIYSNDLSYDTTVEGLASDAMLEFWYPGYDTTTTTVNLAGDDTGSEVFNVALNGKGDPAALVSTAYAASPSDYFDDGIDEHFGTLVIGAAETLNLTSINRCKDADVRDADGTTDGIDLSYIHYGFKIDAASLQTLNVSGDVSVDLTGMALTSVTSVNAGTFTGDLAISMAGNTNDLAVTGGSGHDIITGGDGADVIAGGTGGDVLTGNAGNDTFVFGIGASGLPSDGTNTKAFDLDTGVTTLTIAGTFQEGDLVVANQLGYATYRYTVQQGDSNDDVAAGLAAAIDRDYYLDVSSDGNVVSVPGTAESMFSSDVAYAVTADQITDLTVGDMIDLSSIEALDSLAVVWNGAEQATSLAGADITFTADYDVFVGSVGGQDYLFYETTAQGSDAADAGTLEVVEIEIVGTTPANWAEVGGLITTVA